MNVIMRGAAIALGTGTIHAAGQGLRLLRWSQGWTLGELAPALALEALLGAAVATAALAIGLAVRRRRFGRLGVAGVTVVLLAIGFAAGLRLQPPTPPPPEPLPPATSAPGAARTVLLITGDTLRRDHVSAYDDALHSGLTPRIDGLAEQGVLYLDAVTAAPLTLPSHTTLLSGVPPDRHGAVRNGRLVPGDLHAAPEVLAAAGYRTGGFVSTSVLHGSHGLRRWFGVYRDELGDRPGAHRLPLTRFLPEKGRERRLVKEPGSRTVDRALRWMAAQPDDAYIFAWVHLYDAHTPHSPSDEQIEVGFEPPALPCTYADHPARHRRGHRQAPSPLCTDGVERRTRKFEAGYVPAVRELDTQVGRLLDGLVAMGRDSEAAIVFAADHGESIGEHGQVGSHEYSLYEGVARVPLIVRPPPAASVSHLREKVPEQVGTARVAATLARLGGLAPLPEMASPDLLEAALAAPDRILPTVVVGPSPIGKADGNHPGRGGTGLQIAVRTATAKVLVDGGGYIERYDLVADPAEVSPIRTAAEREAAQLLLQEVRRRGPIPLPGLMPPRRRPLRPRGRRATPPTGDELAVDLAPFVALDQLSRAALRHWSDGTGSAERSGMEADGGELPKEILEALRSLGYAQ